MEDKAILEKKSLEDLRYIAKMLGIRNLIKYRKASLIELIASSKTDPSPKTQEVPVVPEEIRKGLPSPADESGKPVTRAYRERAGKADVPQDAGRLSKMDPHPDAGPAHRRKN